MKILNFGSLNIDYTYCVDHIVREGETTSADKINMNLGGKGFNQSIALARAGLEIYHAGNIGTDGKEFIQVCKENEIITDYIRTVIERCGHTIIQVDKKGQNSIVIYGGANQMNTQKYVDFVLENFEAGDIVLLQNEINEVSYIIDKAYEKGMKIILNPSPIDKKVFEYDLEKISMFILNETEGLQLTGKSEPIDIIKSMQESYKDSTIVLTLGKDGSIYCNGDETIKQLPFNVEAVDTTAAGDTYTGYFVSGIVKGISIKKTMELASKAAALAVMKEGAAQSIPTLSEVEKFVFS